MNKREKRKLNEIYRDCESLDKRGDLTEYGEGQRDLCIILLKKNKS